MSDQLLDRIANYAKQLEDAEVSDSPARGEEVPAAISGRRQRVSGLAVTSCVVVAALAALAVGQRASHRPPAELSASGADVQLVFPVDGNVTYIDTFGRADTALEVGDSVTIFAPYGSAVRAIRSGKITAVTQIGAGNTDTIRLLDSDNYIYFYSGVRRTDEDPGPGTVVLAGQRLGSVGLTRSGSSNSDAPPPHLRLKVLRGGAAFNPNPLLRALQSLDGQPAPDIARSSGLAVRSDVQPWLAKLLQAARRDGLSLSGGGYRSAEQQRQLRRAHCGDSVYAVYLMLPSMCRPPTAFAESGHVAGTAVDFVFAGRSVSIDSDAYRWLSKNAARYGFVAPNPQEPWHWEFRSALVPNRARTTAPQTATTHPATTHPATTHPATTHPANR